MPMFRARAIAVAFILASHASLRAQPWCFWHNELPACRKSPAAPIVPGWKITDPVCCCKTYTGRVLH